MINIFATVVFALIACLAGTAYGQNVPDVSKWDCPERSMIRHPEYGVEICVKDGVEGASNYTKVDGQVVLIHEHRMVDGVERFYNAIKTTDGTWKEVLLSKDEPYRVLFGSNGAVMVLEDDEGRVVGTRGVPLKK